MWQLRDPPRRWQVEASDSWSRGGYHGIAEVVTGGGKTYLGLLLTKQVVEENPTAKVLVLVPSTALLDQWKVAFLRDLGISEAEISCFGAGYGTASPMRRVNIAVVNTARTLVRKIPSQDFSSWMLIADECHRYASPANAAALRCPYRWSLGLSATPERPFDRGFEELLLPLVGPIIYRYSYEAAKRDGVISPFGLWNYKVPLSSNERAKYAETSKRISTVYGRIRADYRKLGLPAPSSQDLVISNRDNSASTLRRLLLARRSISINAKMRIPAAAKIATQFGGAQTLLFHERVAQANVLRDLLEKMGARCTIYHSQISPIRRSLNLFMFRQGLTGMLVTCRALDEGLDVPEAEVGVIAASTRSLRQRIQRMGRILRKAEGKDFATVCTVYATDDEERDLREEAGRLRDVAQVRWFSIGHDMEG